MKAVHLKLLHLAIAPLSAASWCMYLYLYLFFSLEHDNNVANCFMPADVESNFVEYEDPRLSQFSMA